MTRCSLPSSRAAPCRTRPCATGWPTCPGPVAPHPVLFGSAITGAGTDALLGALTTLLPAAPTDADAPTSATVFKIERGPAGEKLAYVRMFAGAGRIRDRPAPPRGRHRGPRTRPLGFGR